MSNGKGSKPRNCFSKEFRDNYDDIKWNAPTFVKGGVEISDQDLIEKEKRIDEAMDTILKTLRELGD